MKYTLLFFYFAVLLCPPLRAQFPTGPLTKTELGRETSQNKYLLYLGSGSPGFTPADDNDVRIYADTTGRHLYQYTAVSGWQKMTFDAADVGTLTTFDGNEDLIGYSSIIGGPVRYDVQGVFSNVLNDQNNGLDFSESGANQINIDLDLSELSLGTSFDGAFLLMGNYGGTTERTIYFQHLLKNTLTSTDGSVTFTDNTFTLDLSASSGGGGTDDQTIDIFSFSSPTLSLSLENDGEATKTVNLSALLDNTDSQTLSLSSNTLSISGGNSVSLSAYDMNNFNIQADGGIATSITDNETINFDAGTNMTISRSGNTILFESTGGASGVSSITGGTGINPDGTNTGAVTLDLDLSELPDLTTWDGLDFLAGRTSTGAEAEGSLQEIFGDMLKSSDASISIAYDSGDNTYDLTTGGGSSGVSSLSVGTGLDGGGTGAVSVTLDLSELSLSSGYDYNDFLVGTTSVGTESRTNVLDMFDNTLTAGSGISLTNTGTSLQISATGGGGTQLTQEEVQDYVGTMVSGNTEVGISVTYDDANNEFDFVATDASTTNELQDFDIAQLSGTQLELSLTQDPTTHTIDLSGLGGGSGMTSWSARADDGGSVSITDGYVLDFDGLAGINTTSASGDVNIELDGDEFIDGNGSADGSYYMWVWKGVITYREKVQNLLENVLSAGEGMEITTIGNSIEIANKQESGIQTGTTNGSGQFTISHSLGSTVIPTITGRNGLIYSVTSIGSTSITVTMLTVSSGFITPATNSPYNVCYLLTAP